MITNDTDKTLAMKILSPQTPICTFLSALEAEWLEMHFSLAISISALLVVQELDSTLRLSFVSILASPGSSGPDPPICLELSEHIFLRTWCWTDAQLGTLFQNLSDMKCSRKYAYLITWLIDCHLEHSLPFAKVEYPTRATWMDLPGVVLQPIAQDQWLRLFGW